MTDVETSHSIQDPSSGYADNETSMMDDDAYLMTMVEADALLPSNMTFSGLFEGDNELNPDELTGKLIAARGKNPLSRYEYHGFSSEICRWLK